MGWCAVDRRSEHIRPGQTPWKGRSEDEDDYTIWAITCFAVHVGHRKVFEAAGFEEVSHPSKCRCVM